MACNPALHHWLHGDAEEPGHQCAVTTISDGHVDQPGTADVLVTPVNLPAEIVSVLEPAGELPPGFRACTRERAPPT